MDKSSQTQDFELLTEIAIAYYCDEVTQEEIANRFGFSRIKIGRLLKRAKEEGIVEINVRYHPVFSTQLEKQMQERFPISRALIALDHNDEDEQRRQVAALVSNYLANNLRDNMVVAVGQGRNVAAVAEHISPIQTKDCHFVCGIGGTHRLAMSSTPTISAVFWRGNLAAAANRSMRPPTLKIPSLKWR